MPTALINDINIYYEDHGGGFPVLLSHGYSANGRMWAPQIEALCPRYRLITWDMRGHGQTDSPECVDQYSEDLTVADMHGLLEHLHIPQAVVGGLSMGGYMSLAFYLRHPEMVRALVLSDTGPGYRKDEARETWNKMAEARARDFEERGLEALGLGAEVLVSALSHRSAQGLALSARGMLAMFGTHVIDALPKVRVPTLVIVGENDQPFLAATDYMAAKIPGARKVVIEGAGHAANIERAEAFNAALLEFLDGLGIGDG
jgi:pimeloyl-ACP methyl ester carboxylesterase